VLIRVKAFGINRSEMFTRQGHSPGVAFPRVLGIECVGIVEAAPGTSLQKGQTVAALMGGMGRLYDGGYAEYTLVPAKQVIPLQTTLDWATLGAVPETWVTAWGTVIETLQIQSAQTLLIRGATSALGLTAAQIARDRGLTVIGTTRSEAKRHVLLQKGFHHVFIDQGSLATTVRDEFPQGVGALLELVGTATLVASLRMVKRGGRACYAGILGNAWVLPDFEPFEMLPHQVWLTTYDSGHVTAESIGTALQTIVERVEAGRYTATIDRIFSMDEIVEAHRIMDSGKAAGKLVVVTE
jgi:NADPH:quinone reductase-like Zn-dependent oxidoreductase